MARVPQAAALALVARLVEPEQPMTLGDLADRGGLLGDLRLPAVELQKQRRRDPQVQLVVAVDHLQGALVDELDARDRDPVLGDLGDAGDRSLQRLECQHGRRHGLGRGVHPQRRLDDEPERALRADEQSREVVAGRGLARPGVGADQLAVGGHDEQGHDVLAHRPVAHRGRARRAGRDHAADRRVGARVDAEEHALGAQPRIQLPRASPRPAP